LAIPTDLRPSERDTGSSSVDGRLRSRAAVRGQKTE